MTRYAPVLAAFAAASCTRPISMALPAAADAAIEASVGDASDRSDAETPDATADGPVIGTPPGPPDAAYAPPACQSLCTAGAQQCSGTELQTCVAAVGGCLAWSSPSACPAPPRAVATCSGAGLCKANCNSASIQCLGGELRCDPARSDFEDGVDGWELAPGSAVGTISASKAQAHGGSGALAVSWSGNQINSDVRVLKRICDPAFTTDLRGRLVTAWIRFDGPALPSACTVCQGAFVGLPGAYPDAALSKSALPQDRGASGDITLAERARVVPVVGQWQQLTGYFPQNEPGAGPDDLWLKTPVALLISCSLATSDCTTPYDPKTLSWTGTVYFDEIVVN